MKTKRIGERLKEIREQKHETPKDLATATGFSVAYIHTLEQNAALPSIETCQKIANHYRVSLSVFLLGVRIELDELPKLKNRRVAERVRYQLKRVFYRESDGEIETTTRKPRRK